MSVSVVVSVVLRLVRVPGTDCKTVLISLSLNEPPRSSPNVSMDVLLMVGVVVAVAVVVVYGLYGRRTKSSDKEPPKSMEACVDLEKELKQGTCGCSAWSIRREK